MKNYRKHIDDFFREKLGSYAETPPAEVWEDLEKRLDGIVPSVPGHSYRWLWHVGIVSVLVIFAVSVTRKIAGTSFSGHRDVAANTAAIVTTNNATATTAAMPATTAIAANTKGTATASNTGQPGGNNINNTNSSNTPNSQNTSATQPSSANNTKNNSSQKKQTSGAKRTAAKGHNTSVAENDDAKNNYNGQYSSKASKPSPAEEDVTENNAPAASPNTTPSGKPKETAAATAKKTAPAAAAKTAIKDDKKHTTIDFPRFEAGVKAGYEGSFTGGAASKLVVSPYLQYNLSRRFSLMVQPAVKAANVSSKSIGDDQAYYQVNEDGKVTQDWVHTYSTIVGGTIQAIDSAKYTYTQTHNNIVKSNTVGGTYMEAELPVLLKYSICKKVSVYGGVNLVYSKLTGVTEHTSIKQGILQTKDTTVGAVNSVPAAPNTGITYTGTPYSAYKGPAYPGTPAAQFNVGYMLGFSYAYSKKWLFDALVEQAPAAADVKGGYNINTPLSATYFRITVGYKLTR